jgi:hypothetical protein
MNKASNSPIQERYKGLMFLQKKWPIEIALQRVELLFVPVLAKKYSLFGLSEAGKK